MVLNYDHKVFYDTGPGGIMQVFENILEEMTQIFNKIMSWRIIFLKKKLFRSSKEN
jgi:hypothetical protein